MHRVGITSSAFITRSVQPKTKQGRKSGSWVGDEPFIFYGKLSAKSVIQQQLIRSASVHSVHKTWKRDDIPARLVQALLREFLCKIFTPMCKNLKQSLRHKVQSWCNSVEKNINVQCNHLPVFWTFDGIRRILVRFVKSFAAFQARHGCLRNVSLHSRQISVICYR